MRVRTPIAAVRLRAARRSVLALVVSPLLLAAAPAVSTASTTAPLADAWYRATPVDGLASPLCDAGLPAPGCDDDVTGGAVALDPYPEGTLHVSVNAGNSDTVTYLELVRPADDATVTELQLVLALGPETDGSADPGSARFQACPATGVIEPGTAAAPASEAPPADCTTAVRAILMPEAGAGGVPAFVADLRPLLAVTSGDTMLVALVPTEAAFSESDTWHVAFSSADRADATTPPVALTVEVRATDAGTTTPPPPTGDPAPAGQADAGTVPPPTTASVPPVAPVVPSTTVEEPAPEEQPAVALPPAVAPAPAAGPATPVLAAFPIGLVYPGVFAVPLALVLFGGVAASALVRPLPLED